MAAENEEVNVGAAAMKACPLPLVENPSGRPLVPIRSASGVIPPLFCLAAFKKGEHPLRATLLKSDQGSCRDRIKVTGVEETADNLELSWSANIPLGLWLLLCYSAGL